MTPKSTMCVHKPKGLSLHKIAVQINFFNKFLQTSFEL